MFGFRKAQVRWAWMIRETNAILNSEIRSPNFRLQNTFTGEALKASLCRPTELLERSFIHTNESHSELERQFRGGYLALWRYPSQRVPWRLAASGRTCVNSALFTHGAFAATARFVRLKEMQTIRLNHFPTQRTSFAFAFVTARSCCSFVTFTKRLVGRFRATSTAATYAADTTMADGVQIRSETTRSSLTASTLELFLLSFHTPLLLFSFKLRMIHSVLSMALNIYSNIQIYLNI